jgi:hypothetical protein
MPDEDLDDDLDVDPVADDLDEEDLEDLDVGEEEDADVVDDDDDNDEDVVAEDSTAVAAVAARDRDAEDEDDEEEEEDDDEVEASLDVILKERLVVVDDDDEDDDDEPVETDDRSDSPLKVLPKQPGEFVCQSCFLVKHPSQLADPERHLCRDCV